MRASIKCVLSLWIYDGQSAFNQLWSWQNDPNQWLESIHFNDTSFPLQPSTSDSNETPRSSDAMLQFEGPNMSFASPIESRNAVLSDTSTMDIDAVPHPQEILSSNLTPVLSPEIFDEIVSPQILNESIPPETPHDAPFSPDSSDVLIPCPLDDSNVSFSSPITITSDPPFESPRTPSIVEWDKKAPKESRKSKAKSARRKQRDSAEREQKENKLLDDILQSRKQQLSSSGSQSTTGGTTKLKLFCLERHSHSEVIQFESELMTKFPSDHFVITSRLPHSSIFSIDEYLEITPTKRAILEYVGSVPVLLRQFKSITDLDLRDSTALKKWLCLTFEVFLAYPQTGNSILRLTMDIMKGRPSGELIHKLIRIAFNYNNDDHDTERIDQLDTNPNPLSASVSIMARLPDDLFIGDEAIIHLLDFASVGWQHCLSAHQVTITAISQNPTWFNGRTIPKMRFLQSDSRKTIKEYVEAVHTFFKLFAEHFGSNSRGGYLLIEAVRRKINEVHDANRLLSDPVIISMLIGDIRSKDKSQSISVVTASHDTMDSVIALLKPMLERDITLKMEQFTATKRQRNTKRSKRLDLPHFTVFNEKHSSNVLSELLHHPGSTSTAHVVKVYFVDTQYMDSFCRALYEQDRHELLIVPHQMFQNTEEKPSNVLWYLRTLDLLHYQSVGFLNILRCHAMTPEMAPSTLFYPMINDWIVQMISIHRSLVRNLKGDSIVFKTVDRKLMTHYRDKLVIKDSYHSRLLVSIRNAVYHNRSAVYSTTDHMISECIDLIYDFFEIHLRMTYQVQESRIYDILNESEFARNVLHHQQRGNETFINGFALVNDELSSKLDILMLPIRREFMEQNETNGTEMATVRRNLEILIALFDSSRIFADHLLAAQKLYHCISSGEMVQNAAIVLFHEKVAIRQQRESVFEIFLKPLAERFEMTFDAERYLVKPSAGGKSRGKAIVPGFDLQSVPS